MPEINDRKQGPRVLPVTLSSPHIADSWADCTFCARLPPILGRLHAVPGCPVVSSPAIEIPWRKLPCRWSSSHVVPGLTLEGSHPSLVMTDERAGFIKTCINRSKMLQRAIFTEEFCRLMTALQSNASGSCGLKVARAPDDPKNPPVFPFRPRIVRPYRPFPIDRHEYAHEDVMISLSVHRMIYLSAEVIDWRKAGEERNDTKVILPQIETF